MKKGLGFTVTVVATLFGVLGIASYLAFAETPGVTKDEIVVGVMTDLTGPANVYGQAAGEGVKTFFQMLNDQGGIHGRKVRVIVEDNQWNPARAVSAYKYLVNQAGVFMIVTNIGTAMNTAIMDFVMEDKVPLIPATWAKAMFEPFKRYVFPTVTSYELQIGVLIDYLMEVIKPRDPKIGIIQIEDDYGEAIFDGTKRALAHYKLDIHSKQTFKRADVDFSSQVLNLQKAGCDFVVLATTLAQAANILKEAGRINYKPQYLGAPGPTDPLTIKLAGEFMPATFIGTNCIADWNEDLPGMVKLREVTKKYHPDWGDKYQNFFYQWCYVNSMIAAEGMRRAGPGLTREGFVTAMETIKDFDSGGILPKISYGPDRREACYTSRVLRVDLDKKTFVPVTDWLVPKYLKR